MKKNHLQLAALVVVFAFIVTACGTAGTPPYEATAAAVDAQNSADAIIAEAQETATAIVAAAGNEDSVEETEENTALAQAQATASSVIATANARVEAEVTEEAEVVAEATEEAEVAEETTEEAEVAEEATEEAEVAEETTEEAEVVAEVTEEAEVAAEATEEAEVAEETTEEAEVVAEVTEEAEVVQEVSAEESLLITLVDLADAERGEELFNQQYSDVGFACVTCHMPNSEDRLVGPGMLNLFDRAEDRVEGQGAYTYVYESIRNSQAYIVEEYPEGVMPNYTEEILPDEDIYHIMAYLRTLED
jgi:HD superfamily phosphohydrolase